MDWLNDVQGSRTGRAVILGGGIMGMTSAYYLLKQGWEVEVVEPNSFGQGCSRGNGGMIVPSHFVPLAAPGMPQMGLRMLPNPTSPFGFRMPPSPAMARWSLKFLKACNPEHVERCAPILAALHLASRAEFEKFANQFSFGLEKRGLIMLCRDPKVLEEEAHLGEQAAEYGVKTKILNRQEVEALNPGVHYEVAGGVHFLDDCQLDPALFMSGLHKEVMALGGRTRVGAWTPAETGTADVVVLAAGSWTPEVAARFGLDLPMMAGKGYGFTLPNPPQSPTVCSIFTEARFAMTPMTRGLRFSGTMEIGEPSFEVNKRRVQGILESIGEYLPAFRGLTRPKDVWVGNRPVTPDGMPYLGRVGRLIVASGHGMMGLSLGPITGKLVATLASQPEFRLPRELAPLRR